MQAANPNYFSLIMRARPLIKFLNTKPSFDASQLFRSRGSALDCSQQRFPAHIRVLSPTMNTTRLFLHNQNEVVFVGLHNTFVNCYLIINRLLK